MKKICTLIIVLASFISLAFAGDRDLPGINIITRQQRGADETFRFSDLSYAKRKERLKSKTEDEMTRLEQTDLDEFFDKQKANYEQQMRNDYLLTNYPDEQIVNSVVYEYGTKYLKWPQGYHFNKNKIIVHHTAGDTSSFTGKDSVITYLQDIYKFHTFTRGWGDIGYNFLIDPYGNIYEGRAGGDSVIGAHDAWNNTPSIGVSLMGNFDKQEPTKEQIKSLVSLLTVLSKRYNIDPSAKTMYHKVIADAPYLKSTENYTIAGHRDAGVTSCPGKNLYSLLPQLRQSVISNLAKGVLVSYSTTISGLPSVKDFQSGLFVSTGLQMLKKWQPAFDTVVTSLKAPYTKAHNIQSATSSSEKISSKISLSEAKSLMSGNIDVLLYELSTKFTKRNISCAGKCIFNVDGKVYLATTGSIEIAEGGLLLVLPTEKHIVSSINVSSKINSLVIVTNYKRTSAAKIPRNTFRGSLLFTKDSLKNLTTKQYQNQYVVINTLLFNDYLKGIVETNDSEHTEKIKVMNLISKSYALFYLDKKNQHPSIPSGAQYNAIDNPDMFQKYVGAGLEKTLKKVPSLLVKTKNQILMYSGYVPILPYFSCSAGFTRSAKEKRGWSDTSYLVSRIDVQKCDDFNGHGVGLSGKGAQYLATKGWTYKEILQYYYPGIEIKTL